MKSNKLKPKTICTNHKYKTVGKLSHNGNSIKCIICGHTEPPF